MQSSIGVEDSHLFITFLTCEGSTLIPRLFENGNETSRLFINLKFQKLRAVFLHEQEDKVLTALN